MEKNYILARDGKDKGEIKNLFSRRCALEGCTGVRMHVKWPSGKSTYPCTKGCKADQNRLMQMMNMWNNGSAQEHAVMEQAGIADIKPMTRMVNGQEQTVGATVTYTDDAVQKNFGINTRPASTGGKGIEVSTSGTEAPAIVPDVASYMNSTQASVSAAAGTMEQIPSSTAVFAQNGNGGVDITCHDPGEFAAIEAMASTPISLTPQLTDKGYTATIPQEAFTEAFQPAPTPATQAVRAAAVEYMAPPVPPAPALSNNRSPGSSGWQRPAPSPGPAQVPSGNRGSGGSGRPWPVPVPGPAPGPTPDPGPASTPRSNWGSRSPGQPQPTPNPAPVPNFGRGGSIGPQG